jgi:predicted dinucleotide-binding enzyme
VRARVAPDSANEEPAALGASSTAHDVPRKARVSTFLKSLDLRPLDVGGLQMAQTLEALGLPDDDRPGREWRWHLGLCSQRRF